MNPPPSLPPAVLACPGSLALLVRARVAGDLPADSFDEAWDALPDPAAYQPTAEVENWMRENWETLLARREGAAGSAPGVPTGDSTLSTLPTHARTWMPAFLHALATGATAREAAAAAGIERTTAYRARERDAGFAKAWAAATSEAADLVRAEIRRRAIEGWEEPVYGAGKPGEGTVQVGTVRRFDSGLLSKMALAYCEEYRQPGPTTNVNVNATANAAAASGMTITPEHLARLQARRRAALERQARGEPHRITAVPSPPAVGVADGRSAGS